MTASYDFAYIGLQDVVGDNQLSSYKWIMDNSTLAYNNFLAGDPNNLAHRCIAFRKRDSLKWHDTGCSIEWNALCETSPVGIVY